MKNNKKQKNDYLRLSFKALVNNEACVEGGRHRPWWIAIIMFVLSMILSLVPVFTNTAKKTGKDFVSTAYNMETACERFVEELNDKNVSMKVLKLEDGTKYLEVNEAEWYTVATNVDEHSEQHSWQHKDSTGEIDMEIYYVPELSNEILSAIISNVKRADGWAKRSNSVMIFAKNSFIAYNYTGKSQTPAGNVYGDYKNIDVGFDVARLGDVVINDITYTGATVTPAVAAEYYAGAWNNWKDFFTNGYKYNKGQALWKTTLLMFGINVLITLFMGFMIWVLTRGKTNPFRIYKFHETQLIAMWASLAPAILTLALGFLLTSFAQVLFPLFIGLRVMWLSMKTLRPEYVAPANGKTVDAKPIKK